MRILLRPLCWIFGHRWFHLGIDYNGWWNVGCTRCTAWKYGLDEVTIPKGYGYSDRRDVP